LGAGLETGLRVGAAAWEAWGLGLGLLGSVKVRIVPMASVWSHTSMLLTLRRSATVVS